MLRVPIRPRFCLLATVWAWGLGCGPTVDPLHVDPGGLEFELAFFLELQDESVVRVGAPFGQDPRPFGRAAFDRVPEDHTLFVVSLSQAVLTREVPGYEVRRIAELAVTELVSSEVDATSDPARIPVPADAEVHRVDLSTGDLVAVSTKSVPALSTLALAVPRDLQFCDRDLAAPVPFGARARLLDPPGFEEAKPGSNAFHRFRDLVPLSSSRALGLTGRLLFEIREGAEVEAPASPAGTGGTHHVSSLGLEGADYRALSVSGDGETVWTTGFLDAARGFVARYGLTDDGLTLETLFTTDADGAPLPGFRAVLVDRLGDVVVGGDGGIIFVLQPSEMGFVKVSLPPIDKVDESDDDVQFIIQTPQLDAPHLIGLKGDVLFTGDILMRRFDLEYVRTLGDRPLGASPYLQQVVAVSPQERWAVGRGGIFSRWEPNLGWGPVPLAATPNLLGCTLGGDLNSSFAHYLSVAPDDQHVFLIADQCNAVLAHERVRGCTGVLTLPGEAVARSEDPVLTLLRRGFGRLWIAGADGRLYTAEGRGAGG